MRLLAGGGRANDPTVLPPRCCVHPRRDSDRHFTVFLPTAQLGPGHAASQDDVNNRSYILVDRNLIAIDDFDDHVEGWRSLTLQNRFLRSATTRFFVGQRD